MATRTVVTAFVLAVGMAVAATPPGAQGREAPALDKTGTSGVLPRGAGPQRVKSQPVTAAGSLDAERAGFERATFRNPLRDLGFRLKPAAIISLRPSGRPLLFPVVPIL